MEIHAVKEQYQAWIRSLLCQRWGSPDIVSRGHLHHADQLPCFIAIDSDQPVGLITYHLNGEACEIVTLDSIESGKGVASKLLNAVIDCATAKRCRRVWLITTNDNTNALRYYQKNGFHIAAIYKGAIKESRKLKPEIPEMGEDGIPIRDEIELEIRIQ